MGEPKLSILSLIPEWIQKLPTYTPGKLSEDVAEEMGLAKVIKLASNENLLGPSPKALAAIKEALGGLNRYGDADSRRLRLALAKNLGLNPEGILAGNGSSEFIVLMAHALLGPGLSAVMSRPSFTLYASNAQATGARAVEIPVTPAHGHDLPAILAQVTATTRMAFIDNPLNPTGAWLTPAEIEGFLAQLPATCLLILDEAYVDFSQKPRPDYPALLATGRVAILRTFSKSYGLAGLRAAYLLAAPELIASLNAIRQPFNLNLLAQVGALAALSDQEHLQNSQKATWASLDFLRAQLPPLGLPTHPTEANFLLAGPAPLSATALERALLEKGIIIRALSSFGLPNHVRISAGRPEENQALVEALREILA
ncbi:MAG: histidinol-phosphate transaminase [Deltaproteobacteria bacterium]|jgi:histidinol-phosphate aminotransferase|nr:histidinol-phosphate transaminase [Deltaproteobacteria bacterium]